MRLRILLLSLTVLLGRAAAFGQTADLQKDSMVLAPLNGTWRFHAGDDAAWANPAFNDSGWSLVKATDGWGSQGYKGYAGVGWFRITVTLPPRHGPLALYVTECDASCQYFANGQPIGQIGDLPPHPHWVLKLRSIYTIPENLTRGSNLVLAVRIWYPRSTFGGDVVAQVGEASAIGKMQSFEGYELTWQNTFNTVEIFGNLIAGFACLILFGLRRKEREYLWFGFYVLTWSAFQILQAYEYFYPVPYYLFLVVIYFFVGFGHYWVFEFYLAFFKLARDWVYAIGALSCVSLTICFMGYTFLQSHSWQTSEAGFEAITWACVVMMLVRTQRRGSKEALALLFPEGFRLLTFTFGALITARMVGPHSFVYKFIQYYRGGVQWPFPISGDAFMGDLTNVVVLILLVRRYALSRQDEERLESELEAARTVQEVLVPAETPSIPGFEIEAVYFPAGQVGGDFFQIIATPEGGALVAIGDVSGKGMPAAMTVSLLVGTLRTLAHYTQSPGEILAAMNQRMMARSAGGFTTCLVLRIDLDGKLTAANAGHVPAYLGGRELSLENGLPLGLVVDAEYRESRIQIEEGDKIMLTTDGVPEAMNERRELFGFDRTAGISTEPANAIAETARSFGQQDDVTVVRLVFRPAAVMYPAQMVVA
jgi:sigma-B regulation protein RsbU (phosphoserine phosphatase)